MLSFSVDRSSLSLSALTIDDTGDNAYTVTPQGFAEPETSPRNTTARSRYVHGELVTGTVLNTSTLTLEVWVQGTSTAVLETRCDALVRALARQTRYTITRTLDGQARTWVCQPAGITRTGNVVKGEVNRHEATYRITIPVYPIAGT